METCSFNGTSISMADYGMESLVREMNYEGAKLARKVRRRARGAAAARRVCRLPQPRGGRSCGSCSRGFCSHHSSRLQCAFRRGRHLPPRPPSQAVDEFNARDPAWPRFVMGALGPTNRTTSMSPKVSVVSTGGGGGGGARRLTPHSLLTC